MQCSACGHQNRDRAKFCKMCGKKLELECPSCGNAYEPGSQFCDECGHPLQEKKRLPPSVAHTSPKTYTPKYLADKILTTRNHIEGERKLVTIMAADVTHYTAISEKLDLENVHSIMEDCFKILMTEIHQYEGTINQFLGDGIMAIFGAPVTHEDHAHRACYAALNIQQALQEFTEKLRVRYEIDFRMRIGLNTGQVVVGGIGDDLRMDYMALGDTTNIAFLLEQKAEPGQVLISEKVYSHVQGYFDCKAVGEEKLKNRTHKVTCYALRDVKKKRSRLEIEAEKDALTGFVNREKELSMINDLYGEVKNSKGQVLCIVGDAGRGKSRLIYEFKNQLDHEKVRYLESQCMAFGKNIPYAPIVEILKKNYKISTGDTAEKIEELLKTKFTQLDQRLMQSIPVLLKLLSPGKVNDTSKDEDPERTKEMIFEAIRILILSGSQRQPLVIVVENLQWIDNTSEQLLAYIVESIANFPVFLILTHRLGYDYPFRASSYFRLISLRSLSENNSRDMIQALLPNHKLPAKFIRNLLEKAGGNPLYIEEMIKCLLENQTIVLADKGYKLVKAVKDIEIPETIQEIVLSRVDRLKEYSKMTIQAASVIGREFSLKLISRKDEFQRRLDDCIKELKTLELVSEKTFSPEVEYIFKNIMTKDVIYNSLLLKHRKELHKKIAQAFEGVYKDKIDDYLDMLAFHYLHSDEFEKAIFYLIKAGEKARAVYGNVEAIAYFEDAIRLMNDHPGSWDEYQEKAHLGLAGLYDLVGRYNRSIEHYEFCIGIAKTPDKKSGFLRKIGMVYEKKGDLDKALDFYKQAMQKIDINENKLEAARIFMNIGWVHSRRADFDKALDFNNRALKIFQKQGSPRETAQVYNNLAVIQEFCGNWEEADTYNQESIRLVKQSGDQRKLASFYISAGLLNLKRGSLDEAEEYFNKSYALAEAIGNTLGMANASLNIGIVHTHNHHFEKALDSFNDSLAMFENIDARSKVCQNYIALAELHIKMGNLEGGRHACDAGMEIALSAPYAFDEARLLSLIGEMKMLEGINATEDLARSVEILSSLGRKYELATTMTQLGQAHLKAGDKKKGEEYLGKSKEIFETLVCACE
jgi:class 3 adenylate cyclase/tetratricopeptide (TPR) repeat protein